MYEYYLIIPKANTVVDPGTMMVHLENTSFTNRTVVSTVRLDTLTLLTIPDNKNMRLALFQSFKEGGWGADAIYVRICLYEGLAAFLKESKGFPWHVENHKGKQCGTLKNTAEQRHLPPNYLLSPFFTELNI